jgi:hypothetical protein
VNAVRTIVRCTLVWVLGVCAAMPAVAFEFSGTRQIQARLRDGRLVQIGQVRFEPQPGGSVSFAMTWEHKVFTDHFLSMREFKCLDGPGEIACLVPYPHRHPRTIERGDLVWLEHNLLFMFKQPSEFGAKLWNGMYFRLRAQGDKLVGVPMSVDLNLIAAPPDTRDPPFDASQRSEMVVTPRWLQEIVIE